MNQNVPATSRCIHRQKSSLHSIKQTKKPLTLILLVLKSGGALKHWAQAYRHQKKPKEVHVRQYLDILVKYIRKQECLGPSQKIEFKE